MYERIKIFMKKNCKFTIIIPMHNSKEFIITALNSGLVPRNGIENIMVGREDVIEVFAKQGFYWGGDWSSSKVDDMHFTFAGY